MKRSLILFIILLPFSALAKGEIKYLFYLHNRFVELSGVKENHPEYGKIDYVVHEHKGSEPNNLTHIIIALTYILLIITPRPLRAWFYP